MDELAAFTATDLPPEFADFTAEPAQLGIGRAGKVGELRLGFEPGAESDRTVLREQLARVPLAVQRVLYLEETLPSMAYVFIISPSEGILQGDRYRMDVRVRRDAQVHLTTQSATKVYSMNTNYASQLVRIEVEDGGYLEYIPDQIIPYQSSRFYQRVDLQVHDRATAIYSEVVSPGRVAHGEERFRFGLLALRTVAVNQDDRYRFSESMLMRPKDGQLLGLGLLTEFDTVGFVYVLTPDRAPDLVDAVNERLDRSTVTKGGATLLPRDAGLSVRVLGSTAQDVLREVHAVVDTVRRAVLGAPFSGVRKR